MVKSLAAITVYLVITIGYVSINRLNVGREAAFLPTFLDTFFPFNRHWVWPYYFYFVLLFIPFFFIKTWRGLKAALLAYGITTAISLGFYAFWPTGIDRPLIIANDLSAKLLKFIYEGDKPYNCFPSQHVGFSWTAAVVIFQEKRTLGIIAVIAAILISLSTVFIKQHWFVDMPGGIAVAIIAWLVSYKIVFKESAKIATK